MLRILQVSLITCLLTLSAAGQNRSVYTSLSEKACRALKLTSDEGGSYLGECPGVGGYKLQLLEGDLRQSINVIDPKRRKTELNLWNISGGFSSVGPTAEWRINAKVPIALIVRFNVSENPEEPSRTTSYLVVAKITKDSICITSALRPTRSHNYEARRTADAAASRPCRFQQ